MHETVTTLVLISGSVVAALLATLGMAGAVHVTSRRDSGYMHTIFYAMLLTVVLMSLLSGRDLTSTAQMSTDISSAGPARHPLMDVLQPVISLLILAVSAERIVTHWLLRERAKAPPLMLIAFLVFWLTTVVSPALFGAHPKFSHDFVYALIIGVAASLASGLERDQALKATRNGLLLIMLASLLLIPIRPGLVMDTAYNQGLLPGVPRLAGITPHAVTLGLMAQLGLLMLLARPYARRWLNMSAWVVTSLALFLAQSKTAWLAFLICSGAMMLVRHAPGWWRRVGDPLHPTTGLVSVVIFMLGVTLLVLVFMFGDVGGRLSSFLATPEGAQLASLTGRDRIWAIAWEEWRRNPVFGYGPSIWNEEFRAIIGMSNATHAHNQFMDTLSRAGTVGAAGLVFYAVVLLGMSVRFARATRGLSMALFLALFLRAVSEVPMVMFGYGPDLVIHVLLLMVLAAAAKEARVAEPRKDHVFGKRTAHPHAPMPSPEPLGGRRLRPPRTSRPASDPFSSPGFSP